MMKTKERGVYATPDFEIEVVNVETGFAQSVSGGLGAEDFDSYPETGL